MFYFMRLLLSYFLLLLMAMPALAADEVTSRAMKLYEQHRYENAAQMLRPEMAAMSSANKAAASLALGMNYLGSATLYRALHQSALLVERDYLNQLRTQKTASPSLYADLYLGKVLLDSGKPAEAAIYLQGFAEKKPVQSLSWSLASIELGIAYHRQKNVQQATQIWSSMMMTKPEIKAALAGAYAMVNAKNSDPELMADAALTDAKLQRYSLSPHMIRNVLRAYSYTGATEKALTLLSLNDINGASYVEGIEESKSLNFYDSSLLGDLARVHLNAAVVYLEQASVDGKLNSIAAYYLADAYVQQGNAELALRRSESALSTTGLPTLYRNIALVNQASARKMAGHHAEALLSLQAMAEKHRDDPVLLAEVLRACSRSGMDCGKIEKLSLTALEKGEGKKYFPLNAALGKYYLMQKDYSKAMLYMEAGRDKANKNKIEFNDPLLLLGLAEAYYRNKKFSEFLEIYFEISKEYPVVRQLQDAMQGIYAMEHQSAGDVKIF